MTYCLNCRKEHSNPEAKSYCSPECGKIVLKEWREQYWKNREHKNKLHKEWKKKNKEQPTLDQKKRLRIRANSRSRFSKSKEKCEICESKDNLQLHHEDYLKPYKVVVLCSLCHGKLHRKYSPYSLEGLMSEKANNKNSVMKSIASGYLDYKNSKDCHNKEPEKAGVSVPISSTEEKTNKKSIPASIGSKKGDGE